MSEKHALLQIDGSIGEGGGQVLRSCLTLSMITGRSFHITSIRRNRKKPGLMAQHLLAVDAAKTICAAQVEGASLNSTELVFIPSEIRSGRYKFHIGTAGSTSLVLQTVFLPLSRAKSASSIRITGGTHVPWSPCFHYLEMHWLPYLHQIGFDAHISLEKAGFYPQGRGQISAMIRPVGVIAPLTLIHRGKLQRIEGISAVANLNIGIAERQKRQARLRLLNLLPNSPPPDIRIRITQLSSLVKGTCLLLKGDFEGGSGCFFGLGEIGKPAERVADEAVNALQSFMEADGAVDQYLADQLMLPLSLASGISRINPSLISSHLLTNAAVVEAFLPGSIQVQGQPGGPGSIIITPQSLE